jgi:hypothetical protein
MPLSLTGGFNGGRGKAQRDWLYQQSILHRSDTTCATVSNQSCRFVIPFVIEEIDRVL